jgi:hypothetical protein
MAAMATGCARTRAPSPSEPPLPAVHVRSAHAFAIYEVDVENDITRGLAGLPEGFAIDHERSAPQLGYVYAALEGVPQATMIERVHAWSATGVVPFGDRLLVGVARHNGARSYLVKFRAVVDAYDVAGASLMFENDRWGKVWGIALNFQEDAMRRLAQALYKEGARFRIVVHDLVEEDRLEIVQSDSWYTLAGPHGSLPRTMRFCADNTAVLIMGRDGNSGKSRAQALAAELPPWRDVYECNDRDFDGPRMGN